MRALRMLAITTLSTFAFASAGTAQTVIPLGQFRAIELDGGGSVILRHGPSQRVTILTGDSQFTQVHVDGQRLQIDNCRLECPRGYQMRIEVVTPELPALTVSNGGIMQTLGAFPAQASIEAVVEQGGTIDIRSIGADAVVASVDSGGRIFTRARKSLAATITSGGAVTY